MQDLDENEVLLLKYIIKIYCLFSECGLIESNNNCLLSCPLYSVIRQRFIKTIYK